MGVRSLYLTLFNAVWLGVGVCLTLSALMAIERDHGPVAIGYLICSIYVTVTALVGMFSKECGCGSLFWAGMILIMLILQLIAFLVLVIDPNACMTKIQSDTRRKWLAENLNGVRALLAIGAVADAIALALVCTIPSKDYYEGPLSRPVAA